MTRKSEFQKAETSPGSSAGLGPFHLSCILGHCFFYFLFFSFFLTGTSVLLSRICLSLLLLMALWSRG